MFFRFQKVNNIRINFKENESTLDFDFISNNAL